MERPTCFIKSLSTETKEFPHFFRTEKEIVFRLDHNLGYDVNLWAIQVDFVNCLQEIIQPTLDKLEDDDYISCKIYNSGCYEDIFMPPVKKQEFNALKIYKRFVEICQSFREFLFSKKFGIILATTKNVKGGGNSNKPKGSKVPIRHDQASKNKRSTVTIVNQDNSCGFRALFVSMFYAQNKNVLSEKDWKKQWQNVRKNVGNIQYREGTAIATKCNLEFDRQVRADDWPIIQSEFPDFQIVVINQILNKQFIFKGPDRIRKIYIEFDPVNNHYNSIVNITGYVKSTYFCESCFLPYWKIGEHVCNSSCKLCFRVDCCEGNSNITCNECSRVFKGQSCFDSHIKNKICKAIHACASCGTDVQSKNALTHECGEIRYCKFCRERVEQPHFCYVPEVKSNNKEINKIVVAYDIESITEGAFHEPNLLIFKTVCDNCFGVSNQCEKCSVGFENVLFGEDCIERFVTYLFDLLPKLAVKSKSVVYAFAHNAKAYDCQFILREVWKRNYQDPQVIFNGNKILKLSVANVNLFDSLNYFLQALDKLPKAFDIRINDQYLDKDFFPHSFNVKANYNYSGPIPDLQYYNPDFMSESKKEKFLEYYNSFKQSNRIWSFKPELIAYCQKDVDILLECIMKFRQQVIAISQIDPIDNTFTLASIGLKIFRSNILTDSNVLAQTPVHPYSHLTNHSSWAAQAWLDLQQKVNGINIVREYNFKNISFDGFDKESKTVYEYLGCYHHGHGCSSRTIDDVKLQKWEDRKALIQSYFDLKFFWHCEVESLSSEDKSYLNQRKKYYKLMFNPKPYSSMQKSLPPPVGWADLREALFGGRVNNLAFHYSARNSDFSIKYLDVVSEYPYVIKTRKFPIGHPVSIKENFQSIDSYFGFIKCKILPPPQLYLPILPYRIKIGKAEKLVFTLCPKCTETECRTCTCTELERSITCTWTTEEIKLAVQKGYRILEIYEVLHYEENQVSDQLFAGYINMWLKIKQESSGWPAWVQTEQDRERYIKEYEEKEGIKLDSTKISKNPALRYIAKIFLNSLWGKFAQRPNQIKHEITSQYCDYLFFANDPEIDLKYEFMLDEKTIHLTYKYLDDLSDLFTTNNLAFASYVTAYARLYLYSKMAQIESIRPYSLLYFDTDSVIYAHKQGDQDLECGSYLGDLTDEIADKYGESAKCVEFVALGPKNYGFIVEHNGQSNVEIKAKGLALTSKAKEIVTFATMKDLVNAHLESGSRESVKVPQLRFKITKKNQVSTDIIQKMYRVTSDKRMVIKPGEYGNTSYITLPYGYRWQS